MLIAPGARAQQHPTEGDPGWAANEVSQNENQQAPVAPEPSPYTAAEGDSGWAADEDSQAETLGKPVVPGRFFLAARGGAELMLGSWGGRTSGPMPLFSGGGVFGVRLSQGLVWYDVGVGAALAGSPVKEWPGISTARNENLLLRHLEVELIQKFNVRVAGSPVFFSIEWDLGIAWTLEPFFSSRVLAGFAFLLGEHVDLTVHLVGFRQVRDRHFVWELNGAATSLMLSFRFG